MGTAGNCTAPLLLLLCRWCCCCCWGCSASSVRLLFLCCSVLLVQLFVLLAIHAAGIALTNSGLTSFWGDVLRQPIMRSVTIMQVTELNLARSHWTTIPKQLRRANRQANHQAVMHSTLQAIGLHSSLKSQTTRRCTCSNRSEPKAE